MDQPQKKGFPTWAIVLLVGLAVCVVGCPIVSIVAAIAIPSLLRSRIAANEFSAMGALREFVTCESVWQNSDADRNAKQDYWTGDVSGMYRIEREPAGSGAGIAMIAPAVAQADDDRLGQGAAQPGAALAQGSGTSAGLIAFTAQGPKSGYLFRAVKIQADGKPYAQDPDGDGHAWTNVERFAFQARPNAYNSSGLNTFIVDESAAIYAQDFGNNRIANAEAWPGSEPTKSGWRRVR